MVFDCHKWISTPDFATVNFDSGNQNDATFDTHKAFSTMKETSRTFQDNPVPPDTRLVGWAALVQSLSISIPVRRPSCIANAHIRGSRREKGSWSIFDRRYWLGDGLANHLTFALRHEDLDLLVLKRIYTAIDPKVVLDLVQAAPLGIPSRRAWFLYEMLMGKTLDIPDAPSATAVDLLDPTAYFTGSSKLSRRHRVRNNLLGTAQFCPMIRRTPLLETFIESDLAASAGEIIGRTRKQLVARAASFMLLADSRASFEIEGERPPRGRLERWGRAVLQAGRNELSLAELLRLHDILIEDKRFVQQGLRQEGIFLGERDQDGDPLPEFIGASPNDLPDLIRGLLEANDHMRQARLDPVLQAAATAFGFVYIHPFEDGNGRLHRCLIQHVLAERRFTPAGMVFPVSSVMLDRIDQYRDSLRAHSGPLMNFIEWRTTPKRNVEVLNDTADFYRYFDCTEAAEFLYDCVRRTVDHDLPQEIDYLQRHDEALRRIMDRIEMPDGLAESFILYVRQNKDALGKKRRENEFGKLTDQEVCELEDIVKDAFKDHQES